MTESHFILALKPSHKRGSCSLTVLGFVLMHTGTCFVLSTFLCSDPSYASYVTSARTFVNKIAFLNGKSVTPSSRQ